METKFKKNDIITPHNDGHAVELRLLVLGPNIDGFQELFVLESPWLTEYSILGCVEYKAIEDYDIIGQMDADLVRILYEN